MQLSASAALALRSLAALAQHMERGRMHLAKNTQTQLQCFPEPCGGSQPKAERSG
jgi:hypothetical protein